uniref:Protein archease-like n=1 Tax=Aceria tosichella TaxID=561515 RepID=A0A6G1S579_9ACAR
MAGNDSRMGKYEFLDHTADVQIHAWGDDLREAFENAAVAMTAYITDIKAIEISQKESFQVESDDLQGLLYRFLDGVLFLFNAEPYLLSKRVRILEFQSDTQFRILAECYGETFSLDKHTQGTEIKAITYSAMKIIEEKDRCEVYFIVDI